MALQINTIYSTWAILNYFYPSGTIGAKKKEDMDIINDAIAMLETGMKENEIINLYLRKHEEV
ncbi:MAG: hypothetical protein ACOYM7_08010 [Paludibacter sp.]